MKSLGNQQKLVNELIDYCRQLQHNGVTGTEFDRRVRAYKAFLRDREIERDMWFENTKSPSERLKHVTFVIRLARSFATGVAPSKVDLYG